MVVWIFEDCDEITLFKTKKGALKYLYKCLEKSIIDESKKKEAIKQMREKGYWERYQIYSTKIYN